MVTFLICFAPASAFAGGEGLCGTPTGNGGYDWMAMTPDGWTPATSYGSDCEMPPLSSAYSVDAHCDGSPGASASHPRDVSREQARKVALSALIGVYAARGDAGDSDEIFSASGMAEGASMAWLEDVATSLVSAGSIHVDRRAMCVPRVEGERCESAPPMAVVVSAGSSSPAHRCSVEFEVPWRPGDNELMQPARAKLRVGPSDEHRRLPERPPAI